MQQNLAKLQELIAEQPDLVNDQNENGVSPLYFATAHGNLEIVSFLLDNGADPDIRRRDGMTPLHWAAIEQHAEIAKLLLQCGASLRCTDQKGRTALHHAARAGSADLLKLFIEEGGDPTVEDDEGHTPDRSLLIYQLLAAVNAGDIDRVRAIAEANPALIDCQNEHVDGLSGARTALQLACRKGEARIAKLLIDSGADTGLRTSTGWTPLHFAAQRGTVSIVKYLLKSQASVDARNNEGWTPLHTAAENNRKAAVEALVDHGADVNATDFEVRQTPLHQAVQWNRNCQAIVLLLIGAGADVNRRDRDGMTALVLAEASGPNEVANLLREHGGIR